MAILEAFTIMIVASALAIFVNDKLPSGEYIADDAS